MGEKNGYIKLKSGTDVRGVAVATDKVVSGAILDDVAVRDISSAFVFWLSEKSEKQNLSVAVGYDSRITSQRFCAVAVRSLKASGCKAFDCGLSTTPAMFMMTKYPHTNCDGVIMITASHHPYHMNGLKFFTKDGGVSSAELEQILAYASVGKKLDLSGEEMQKEDYLDCYSALLKAQIIRFADCGLRPLEGLRIVVDAGNGAAGFFASRVLVPLGADVTGSQFLEPDGYFPNHIPNPEDKVAMQSIRDCVLQNKADLGIIFDTDGDRVGIVTADGKEINRNRLIAAAARLVLENAANKGAYIVTDSVTSEGIKEFIEKMGGVHFRYKRGYKNIIGKAMAFCAEGRNAPLAIETSGHAAFRENYFLDDGAYLAVRLIAKTVKLKSCGLSLSDYIGQLTEPRDSAEVRLKLTGSDWAGDAKRVLSDLEQFSQKNFVLAPDNHDGIRASIPSADGWFLLRLSVHDPVMPLNIESNTNGGTRVIASELIKFFSGYACLDISDLEKTSKT